MVAYIGSVRRGAAKGHHSRNARNVGLGLCRRDEMDCIVIEGSRTHLSPINRLLENKVPGADCGTGKARYVTTLQCLT